MWFQSDKEFRCSSRLKRNCIVAALCTTSYLTSHSCVASDTHVDWPDTRAATMAQSFLTLCQEPKVDQLTKWISENLTGVDGGAAIDIARENQAFCKANGGLRPYKIVESRSDYLWFKAVGLKSGTWMDFWWNLDATGKIVSGGHEPDLPPETELPKNLSDENIYRYIQGVVAKQSKESLFSGIVVVARGSHIIATASGGFADRESKKAIVESSQFTLASMGKLFTTVAIGQLMEQGKVSLSDTVRKFFPIYSNETVRDRVTVEMLLSHTSGMGDFLSKRTASMKKYGVKRADEFISLYEKDPLQFEPGSSWSYSNAGFALLGAIVEKASGEDYPTYIRRHILKVAGMRDSDPNNMPRLRPSLVVPYSKKPPTDDGGEQEWLEAEPDMGSPAGSSISTAADLVRFADCLRNGKLIKQTTLDTLAKRNPLSPDDGPYGDGFELDKVYDRETIGHKGGYTGIRTDLKLFLGSTFTVVTLANLDDPAWPYPDRVATALVAEKLKRSHESN